MAIVLDVLVAGVVAGGVAGGVVMASRPRAGRSGSGGRRGVGPGENGHSTSSTAEAPSAARTPGAVAASNGGPAEAGSRRESERELTGVGDGARSSGAGSGSRSSGTDSGSRAPNAGSGSPASDAASVGPETASRGGD